MWYVYIIRSVNFPEQEYVGATAGLKRRLPEHNAGKSSHTPKFKPWRLVWCCAFPDKYKALAFEKYPKSHSGRAFAKSASDATSRLRRCIQPVAQCDDPVLYRP
jgi:putative endonuclease